MLSNLAFVILLLQCAGQLGDSRPSLGADGDCSSHLAPVTALPGASQAGWRPSPLFPDVLEVSFRSCCRREHISSFRCGGWHCLPQDVPAGLGKVLVLLRSRVLRGWKSSCQRLGSCALYGVLRGLPGPSVWQCATFSLRGLALGHGHTLLHCTVF